MKKTRAIVVIFLFGLIYFSKAQSSLTWQPVLNNYDGTNMNEGVEANCALITCGADDYLIIKLTNNNNIKLKATWSHWVQTQTGESKYGDGKQQSLVLEPKTEAVGSCASNVAQLKIKLRDFGITKDQFNYYIAKNFHLISAE